MELLYGAIVSWLMLPLNFPNWVNLEIAKHKIWQGKNYIDMPIRVNRVRCQKVGALTLGDSLHGFESWLGRRVFFLLLFHHLHLLLLPSLFLSLPTVRTLSHTKLVGTCFRMLYNSSRGGKRENSQKNPIRDICKANADLRAMCGGKNVPLRVVWTDFMIHFLTWNLPVFRSP